MNTQSCPRCHQPIAETDGLVCAACKVKPVWWTTDEWATPQDLFDALALKHGPFDLDACARVDTAKCPVFYTKDENALDLPWTGAVWVNPPYSEPKLWCQKAIAEVENGNASRVVMLLPAAVDTNWFHQFVIPYADWYPLKGRPKFIGWMGTPIGSPKAGNVVAIYPKADSGEKAA